jgi:putative DNA primase/helicase
MIETAHYLTENLVPIILLKPGLKRPLTDKDGSWLIIDDPNLVRSGIEGHHRKYGRIPNIGILLHPKSDSHVLCVDIDGSNPQVIDKLKAVGVSRDEFNWRQVTGKRNGHWHLFYYWNGGTLPRIANKPDGLTVDLLSNGYAVIAPSDTSLDPAGGGPYEWVEGHSPFDVHIVDLPPPPDSLIQWWLDREANPVVEGSGQANYPEKSKAWMLLRGVIRQQTRNNSLTRIGGWLRLYHPPAIVEALLLAINDGRCDPPLPENEVRAIVRSIFNYPQTGVNGHPKAVVPKFRRQVDAE